MEGGVTVTSHHLQAHLHVGEIEEVVDVLRRRVFVVGDKKLQDKKNISKCDIFENAE